MLRIVNNLKPFFEDCYKEWNVREYAREIKISAPTASKLLKEYGKEGLLLGREERGFLLFRVNRESEIMKDLSRIYWRYKFQKLIDFINENLYNPTIILFGSLSKLEVTKDSDMDIVVISQFKKKLNYTEFEKKCKREIQEIRYEAIDKINKDLRLNVINGYVLNGVIR